MGIECDGKNLFTIQGEYSANMLREKLLGEKVEIAEAEEAPARPPIFVLVVHIEVHIQY